MKKFLLGFLVYLLVISGVLILCYWQGWLKLSPFSLNELGDFMAGVLTPFALFYVVLGNLQQASELKISARNSEVLVIERRILNLENRMKNLKKDLTMLASHIAYHSRVSCNMSEMWEDYGNGYENRFFDFLASLDHLNSDAPSNTASSFIKKFNDLQDCVVEHDRLTSANSSLSLFDKSTLEICFDRLGGA